MLIVPLRQIAPTRPKPLFKDLAQRRMATFTIEQIRNQDFDR